jgi:hypothetical protein
MVRGSKQFGPVGLLLRRDIESYGEILNRAIPATRKTSSDLPAATAAKVLLWAAPKKDGCKQSRMSRFGARTGVGFSCGP